MQSIQLPVTQTGLEQSIQQALKNAGKNAQINLGTNSRQINALAQPLGRITGQADEFTKSMEAANARVFAFGASVGIINGVSKAFTALVKNTIATEKALTDINVNLNKSSAELDKFGNSLFDLAKSTGQSFQTVADGALELSRQGLNAADVVKRLNDALILSRLSGLDAQQSVEGLTAAINSFADAGISSEQILNKLVVVSQKYAVSERDLIEGIKRSASVADQAGVSLDELIGVITTVQERTARGGAVIGNAFKTIFSKIQDKGALEDLQNLGIQVTDAAGKILPATSILQNLAKEFEGLSQIQQTDIAKKLGGVYQLSNLLAAVKDLGSEQSKYTDIVKLSQGATTQAYQKNAALNQTLDALINKVSISAEQLGATLGKIGLTDNLKDLLNFFGGLLDSIQNILGEESGLGNLVRGLAKGIGNLITGPGLALFGAIIVKLSKDLVQFGFSSLKSFFGIGKAAKDIADVEKSINTALATNIGLQQKLFSLEGNRAGQLKVITDALIQQEAVIRRSASISKDLASPLSGLGVRATSQGLRVPEKNAAGGYMPAVAKESSDISRGVGGARSGDKPVVIPNFNFGGGKKGSIVAHTGEYAIPNFAGSGGTAIFNRNMVQKMGLPAGAKKINASGGFVPNFVKVNDLVKNFTSTLAPKLNTSQYLDGRLSKDDSVNLTGNSFKKLFIPKNPNESNIQYEKRIVKTLGYESKNLFNKENSAIDGYMGSSSFLEVKGGKFIEEDVKLKFLRAPVENYGMQNPLDVWTKERDNIKINGLLVHSKAKDNEVFAKKSDITNDFKISDIYRANKYGRPIKNKSSGFIPNFALSATQAIQQLNAELGGALQTNGIKELEKYRIGDSKQFEIYGQKYPLSQLLNPIDRLSSSDKRVLQGKQEAKDINKQIKSGAKNITVSASDVGGILNISPDFNGLGQASYGKTLYNYPKFVKRFPQLSKILSDNLQDKITIDGVKTVGLPNIKGREGISQKINEVMAPTLVRLASNIYGDYVNALGMGPELAKVKGTTTGGLLTAAAEGDIMEAATKLVLNTTKSISGQFDSRDQGRPYDFTNRELIKKAFGVSAGYAELKRSSSIFNSTEEGTVSKTLRTPKLSDDVASLMLKNYASSSLITREAAGGYIPNFALSENALNSLRLRAEYSGNDPRLINEAKIAKSKLAKYSSGQGVSLRYAFDRDGLIGSRGLTDMVNYAYKQASPSASSDQVYKVFEGIARQEPNLSNLRKVIKQKGMIPNFADPLKDAINREMAAGVPASQIYVDKSPSLKSMSNPMGLMVANRRDEPAGGFQGINRAVREGRDPKMYGAAGGFVPNYAAGASGPDLSPFVGKTRQEALAKELELYVDAMSKLNAELDKATEDYKKASKKKKPALDDQIKALEENKKTLNENSKATRKVITEQTKGILGTGRNITGGKATVKDPNGEKGSRDMLGAIFAVQGAMTALSGATEGATNGFAKLTNGISSVASTATTFLFAGQGLAQSFGGAEKGIGKVVGKLGVYGAVAAGIYTGFKELGKYIDSNNISIQKASESMLRVSDAASKAAINLNTLNPAQQEIVKKRAGDIISGARKYETRVYTPTMGTYGASNVQTGIDYAKFEGVSDELQKGFENLVSQAIGVGVDENDLYNKVRERFQSGGVMTGSEVQDLSNLLSNQISEIAKKGSPTSIIQGLTEEQKKTYAGMTPQEVEQAIATRANNKGETDFKNPLADLQAKFYDAGIKGDITRQESIRKTIELLREQSTTEENAQKETIDQLKVSIAQDKLRNALALSIAKARSFANDSLSQELLKGQELGNIDEKALRNLENKIALREVDRELQNASADLIQQQINEAKKITAASEKAIELEKELNNLSVEDLQDRAKVNALLNKTSELLSQNSGLTEEQQKALQITLDKLFTENDLKKQNLKIQQDQTNEYKEQVRQLDLIGQASKRAFEAQVFKREIGSTKEINANERSIRDLEFSKLGKSPEQTRRIDLQIAALKENTVALQQKSEQDKIFEQFKGQLLESNKTTDIIIKNLLNQDINDAKTAEQLNQLAQRVFANDKSLNQDQQQEALAGFLEKFQQALEKQGLESQDALEQARAETLNTGRIEPVISALEMFRRSLLENTFIIDQKIQDLELQKLTSISGEEISRANYDIETLRQQQGKSAEEAAKIARDRQNKPLSQLFDERFSKTSEELSMNLKNNLVDGSLQFKNNLIDGITQAVESGASLSDILRNAALEFARSMTKASLSNVFDSLGGVFKGVAGFASGGKVTGGSGSKDDVPAMLMGGEFVMNKKAVQKYGPDFLNALNNGSIGGYADGGQVQKGPQGNFYTPGQYGQGAIMGSKNLLDFATQSYTTGERDEIINSGNFASINLEAESARLTNFGRQNNPAADALRSAKEEAFSLYLTDYQQKQEAKKQEKEQKKALRNQLIMAGISLVGGAVISSAATGFGNAYTAASQSSKGFSGFLSSLGAGAKGMWSGYNGHGGLSNIFSGEGFTKYGGHALPVSESDLSSMQSNDYANPAILSEALSLTNSVTRGMANDIPGIGVNGSSLSVGSDIMIQGENGKYIIPPRDYMGPGVLPPIPKAVGGMIPARSGIDTVSTMLTGGEFVMNRAAAQNIGAGNLQSLNSGAKSLPTEEKSEELNDRLISKLDELIEASGAAGNITINVEGGSGKSSETSDGNSAEGKQQLARQIRDAVLKVIQDEKRLGGQLRRGM